MAAKEFIGTLRPRITFLGEIREKPTALDLQLLSFDGEIVPTELLKYQFKVEWIEEDNPSKVVWTETVKVLPGFSFVPQVSGYGAFKPGGAILIGPDNRRHFVLNPDMGIFGANVGTPEMKVAKAE